MIIFGKIMFNKLKQLSNIAVLYRYQQNNINSQLYSNMINIDCIFTV